MTINIENAYNYYLNNLSRSCDTRTLDANSFRDVFVNFLETFHHEKMFFPDREHIPFVTKCGKSKYITIDIILKKVT
jgi:hypothetical protein